MLNNLKKLECIFPKFILLLIYIPTVLGIFIDPVLFDSRSVIIDLIWIPLLTIPNYIFKKKQYFQFIVLLIYLIGVIQIVHWIAIKGPLTVTSLLVISNTNYHETLDFINLKASFKLLILIPYSYLFVLGLHRIPKYDDLRLKPIFIWVILGISFVFILENVVHGRLIRKGIPQIAKVGFSFFNRIQLYKEASKDVNPKVVNAISIDDNMHQTFVLIIGESCSRRHMSLYGASINTNPKLSMRNDLKVFKNVVSPYSNTLESVLSILSKSNLEQSIAPEDEIDLVDIFHSAGFKTFWISNQSPIGVWDNLVTVFANQSDVTKYVNLSSNSSFEATYTSSFDEKVFAPFQLALEDESRKKFIVVHLMGSHASYKKRYPKKYNVFKDDHSKEKKIISEYDNSMLYNDFIVDKLITITQKEGEEKSSSLIYLSDHGENVYDEENKIGHDYSNKLPKSNVEIPFLLWLSPIFIIENSELVHSIDENLNKPFVSDDLFHSIIDLNLIQSPHFIKSKSIFNKDFNYKRKRILGDGKDYDDN